jgi:hypothetical protein
MSLPGRGNGFALETEVTAMWLVPVSVTLRITKTRRGWQVFLRVRFVV